MPLKLIKNLRGILIIGEVTIEEDNVLTEVVNSMLEVINVFEKVNNPTYEDTMTDFTGISRKQIYSLGIHFCYIRYSYCNLPFLLYLITLKRSYYMNKPTLDKMKEGEIMKGWKILFQLFWTFFKISPVTFGGGFAMVPLIEKEVVEKRGWLKSEDVTDVFALSQSVPGAVAINSATFIGQRIGGVRGAIAAMLGVSLPTFFIVLILGVLYFFIQDNPKVEAAFISIRVSIVAIIVYAAIKIAKNAIVDKSTFGMMVIGIPALFFIHPIIAIGVGAVTGIITISIKMKLGYKIERERKAEKDDKDKLEYFMGAGI